MARLLAFGGDNGRKPLADLDAVDLHALQLAREWGVSGKSPQATWTFSPCPRPDCGAIVSGYSDVRILWARNGA